jgi:ferritin-like metal-binding protein YciE
MEKNQDATSLVREYLIDAIAAEKSFETQLRAMARQSDLPAAEQVFSQHAEETRHQHQRLTERLQALGGSPSAFKTFLAELFAFTPKAAQAGHSKIEVATQNLVVGYSVENSEIAMYEALAAVANIAGDLQTEQLAREIQEEERRAASKIWHLIAPTARESMLRLSDAREQNPNLSAV